MANSRKENYYPIPKLKSAEDFNDAKLDLESSAQLPMLPVTKEDKQKRINRDMQL